MPIYMFFFASTNHVSHFFFLPIYKLKILMRILDFSLECEQQQQQQQRCQQFASSLMFSD